MEGGRVDACASLSDDASEEAGAFVSAAGERMRESGLDRTMRWGGLIVSVVESERSVSVVSEDQQAAFLWERQ